MSASVKPERPPPASSPDLARTAVQAVGQALGGTGTVDPWGLDPVLFDLWAGAARVGCVLEVDGGQHLPAGPFLIVVNRRWGDAVGAALAAAVQDVSGRRLRWAGLADVAPIATIARRLGGVLAEAAEVATLLRSGAAVASVARRGRPRGRVGLVDAGLVRAAVHLDAPVVPVAMYGRLARRWIVHIGRPLDPPRHRNPLAVTEHAERVRGEVQDLLDD